MTKHELKKWYQTLVEQLQKASEGDSDFPTNALDDFRDVGDILFAEELTDVDDYERIPISIIAASLSKINVNSTEKLVSLLLHEIESAELEDKERWELRTKLAASWNCEFATMKQRVKKYELEQLKRNGSNGDGKGDGKNVTSSFIDVAGFIRNAKGQIKAGTHNAKVLLSAKRQEWEIKKNDFTKNIIINDKLLDDNLITEILCWTELSTGICPWQREQVKRAIMLVANDNTFHPVKDYLDSLVWDGKERLNAVPENVFGLPNSHYFSTVAKCFFIQAVARIYEPGCKADYVLTLISRQGCKKGTFVASLVPDEAFYLNYNLPQIHDKEATRILLGKWIIEIAEGHGFSKSDVRAVKSFIDRRVDTYRHLYSDFYIDHPRSSVFVLTTNEETPLQDATGNRRFWIVRLPDDRQIDTEYVSANREQLWAEAIELYRSGHAWHYEDEETALHQQQATEPEYFEEVLDDYLLNKSSVTLPEVADMLGLSARDMDKSKQIRIGIALKRLGWKKNRTFVWKDGKSVAVSLWEK